MSKLLLIRQKESKCNGTVTLNIPQLNNIGNQVFIYLIGRLYAEKHKLNLITKMPDSPYRVIDNVSFGRPYPVLRKYIINDKSYDAKKNELNYHGPGNYHFFGYFQFENIIYENIDRIKEIINFKQNKCNQICLHLRLGDFYNKERHLIISINYYIDCIKRFGGDYDKVYIVSNKINKEWEKKYMEKLFDKIRELNKEPIFNNNTIEEDIKILINSKTLITSNSTFCFLPVVLSEKSNIISFPYTGENVLPNNDIIRWPNNPIIFKYNKKDNYHFNYEFSKNKNDYFEKLF